MIKEKKIDHLFLKFRLNLNVCFINCMGDLISFLSVNTKEDESNIEKRFEYKSQLPLSNLSINNSGVIHINLLDEMQEYYQKKKFE